MSAEAPKQFGAEHQPSELGGCLPRFLRKFVVDPPQQTQSPPGLDDFAGKIQQGIANHLTVQRQQELDRQNAEAASKAAELSIQAKLAQKQREIRETKAAMMAEARQVLDEFQVEDRLRYIQRMVWKGQGMIRFVEPELYLRRPGSSYPIDQKLPSAVDSEIQKGKRLGGLELVHQYQLPCFEETEVDSYGNYGGPFYRWRYTSRTSETSLSVVVLDQEESGQNEKMLSIHSKCDIGRYDEGHFGYHYSTSHQHYSVSVNPVLDVNIASSTRDSKALLDQAFATETAGRLFNNLLPSQLEKSASKILAEARRKPCWGKWTTNVHDL